MHRHHGIHEAHERIEEHTSETLAFPNLGKVVKKHMGIPRIRRR